MNHNKNGKRTALDRLAVALVDDILSASDAEILADAKEDGIDPSSSVTRLKGIYKKALANVQKSRLAEAKAEVEAERRGARPDKVARLDPSDARARLQSILDQDPETRAKLTMAARKGDSLSDADVRSMLEDLEELGLLPPGHGKGRDE